MTDSEKVQRRKRSVLRPLFAGLLVGALVWFAVLVGLFVFGPHWAPPARYEGKGGYLIEGLWYVFGLPLCIVFAWMWAFVLGPRLNRKQRTDIPSP